MKVDRQGDRYAVELDAVELRTVVNCLLVLPKGHPDDYLDDLIGTDREGIRVVQQHLLDGRYEADRRHFLNQVLADDRLSGRLGELDRELSGLTLEECGRVLHSRAEELSVSLEGSDIRNEVFDRLAVGAVVEHIAALDGGGEFLRQAVSTGGDAVRFAVAQYWPGLERSTALEVLGAMVADTSAPSRAFAAAVTHRRLLAGG